MSGYVSGRTSLTTVQTGNIAANAVTLAKMAGGTDGNLITYDASGDPAAVATGSDGQVLTSGGAGVAPTFAAGGKVLQVVSTTKTDTFSLNSSTFTDITDMSAAVTPAATSSKVLITATINISCNSGYASVRLLRGATAIALGDAASDRIRTTTAAWSISDAGVTGAVSLVFLDSPSSTSETTYKLQLSVGGGAQLVYINRTITDTDNSTYFRSVSGITIMEIGA